MTQVSSENLSMLGRDEYDDKTVIDSQLTCEPPAKRSRALVITLPESDEEADEEVQFLFSSRNYLRPKLPLNLPFLQWQHRKKTMDEPIVNLPMERWANTKAVAVSSTPSVSSESGSDMDIEFNSGVSVSSLSRLWTPISFIAKD